jgi:hypothetical protein
LSELKVDAASVFSSMRELRASTAASASSRRADRRTHATMGHNDIWASHPANYGKGSRRWYARRRRERDARDGTTTRSRGETTTTVAARARDATARDDGEG